MMKKLLQMIRATMAEWERPTGGDFGGVPLQTLMAATYVTSYFFSIFSVVVVDKSQKQGGI
jgi:hypothetical protein